MKELVTREDKITFIRDTIEGFALTELSERDWEAQEDEVLDFFVSIYQTILNSPLYNSITERSGSALGDEDV